MIDRNNLINLVRRRLESHSELTNLAIPPDLLNVLPYWVLDVIPPHIYRKGCGVGWDYDDDGPVACACTGHCQQWLPATDHGEAHFKMLCGLILDDESKNVRQVTAKRGFGTAKRSR